MVKITDQSCLYGGVHANIVGVSIQTVVALQQSYLLGWGWVELVLLAIMALKHVFRLFPNWNMKPTQIFGTQNVHLICVFSKSVLLLDTDMVLIYSFTL